MTKLWRKSWSIRTIRSYQVLPKQLKLMNPKSDACKKRLRQWIRDKVNNKMGDDIISGKEAIVPDMTEDDYENRIRRGDQTDEDIEEEDWLAEMSSR